jgi:hypothetical protein
MPSTQRIIIHTLSEVLLLSKERFIIINDWLLKRENILGTKFKKGVVL